MAAKKITPTNPDTKTTGKGDEKSATRNTPSIRTGHRKTSAMKAGH